MKLSALALSLALLIVSGCAADGPAEGPPKRLSAETVANDIAIARDAFERVHAGYTRYTDAATLSAGWDAIVARANAEDGMMASDLYLEVQAVLALIRCDHTKANLATYHRKWRDKLPTFLPIVWDVYDSRAFVTQDAPAAGLERGDEILAIDGEAMKSLIDRFAPLVPVDGYTEHARSGELSYSVELRGGAIEHFLAVERTPNPSATLSIRSNGEAPREVSVARINFGDYTEMQREARDWRREFSEAVRWERIGDNAAYLAVDTFVNYRNPADPAEMFDPIFAALNDENRDTLILDLRNNGGGSNEPMAALLARLIDAPTSLAKDIRVRTIDFDTFKPYASTWNQEALNPKAEWFDKNSDGTLSIRPEIGNPYEDVLPADITFGGQLIVLIGTGNSSGSTLLIAKLKDLGRATLVGMPTGGSAEGPTAGVIFFLKLPGSELRLRLPVQRIYNAIGEFREGWGISPDIDATPTLEQWLAGEDIALERAIALIGSDQAGSE